LNSAWAVRIHFPVQAGRLRRVLDRLSHLPIVGKRRDALVKLQDALETCLRRVRQTQPTVLQVKANLDVLRDGLQLLRIIDAELTDEMVQRVRATADTRDHQGQQLLGVAGLEPAVASAIAGLREHLTHERPWRTVADAEGLAATIRAAYTQARTNLLRRQEDLTDQARSRVKTREGFSTLTAEQAHNVLRPISEAQTDTTAEAVAPPLSSLEGPFDLRLQKAEDEAFERLDALRGQNSSTLVVWMDLGLKNREIATLEDVDRLLEELRGRLLAQLETGSRIRLA
jgi:hypothetical protein